MEYNRIKFIFQLSPPCGPYTSSISVAVLHCRAKDKGRCIFLTVILGVNEYIANSYIHKHLQTVIF